MKHLKSLFILRYNALQNDNVNLLPQKCIVNIMLPQALLCLLDSRILP